MQIIQSLGEAMSWFEREMAWGVPPTELRHLSGRLGELYAALITNGQMATAVNQQGYDVVSAAGERISVKTTAMMGDNGAILFNPKTLNKVDQIIILRINTEDMQIETLLNASVHDGIKLMGEENTNGKVSISLSKLTKIVLQKQQNRDAIQVVKSVKLDNYVVDELESGTIKVKVKGKQISPVKPILKTLAAKLNISLLNSNGNLHNTRQLGSLLIKAVESS